MISSKNNCSKINPAEKRNGGAPEVIFTDIRAANYRLKRVNFGGFDLSKQNIKRFILISPRLCVSARADAGLFLKKKSY